MANPHPHHHHHPRKPRRVRAHSERAQGLDPEITAQPHGLSDDIDLSSDGADLSIAPEDLGNHFLSEAVEQGDFGPHDAAELERMLHVDESEPVSGEIDLEVWEALSRGGPYELREVANLGAERLAAAERDEQLDSEPSRSLNMHTSSIRDGSLLDREGAGLNETFTPRVQSDDSGRHARSTSRDALGEQVSGKRAAADGGRGRASKLRRAARATLHGAAGKLRRVASKLAKATRR